MSSYTYDETVANEKISIRNGSFAIVGLNIVSSFAPLFLLRALHANAEEVALYNALPALMTIFATFLGAIWMNYVASKKWFCIYATTGARIFYGFIALSPFFFHFPLIAIVVILLIALMNVPQAFGNLAWQSLIGDLIPEERRANFFGKRNRIITLFGMLATLIPGLILERFPAQSIPPYQFFFFITVVTSIFEVYYLVRHIEHVEIRSLRKRTIHLRPQDFFSMFKNRLYMKFLVGSSIFNLGWQMAWPLFNLYQINISGATAIWMSLFTVASQLSQILTFSLWSRLSLRVGNAVTLAIACFGMAITPILTILSTGMIYLTLVNFLTGAFVGGTNLLLLNYLLEVSPQAQRTEYIAHYNILLGFIGFIAPQIGVSLLPLLHLDSTMVLSTVVRIIGGAYFLWVAKKWIFHQHTPSLEA